MFLKHILVLCWAFLSLSKGTGEWSTCASAINLPKSLELGSTLGCSSDTECKRNYFCGGKSGRRCVECFDCAKVQRQPKRGYDGPVCAHSSVECGSCNSGFEELGGVCIPKVEQRQNPISDWPTVGPPKVPDSDHVSKESSVNWVLASVLTILIVGALLFFTFKHPITCNPLKQGFITVEKYEGSAQGTQSCDVASAPPEEYHQQLPYLPPILDHRSKNYNPLHQARPFAAGNGAGNWIVRDEDEGEDVVDAVVPQTPVVQLPPVNATTGGNNTSNGVTAPLTQGNSQEGEAMEVNPSPAEAGNILSNVVPLTQDYVVGQFSFEAFAWIVGRGNISGESGANWRSAPASPRRIDDTCFEVTSLNEPFSPSRSNLSTDSGTGTNESPSVPSRSGSQPQAISDVEEMSMFDDTFPTPAPTHRPFQLQMELD